MQRADNDTCLSPDRYDAAVFDLDGVITRTAKVHAAAWKAMFDEFLAARATGGEQPERPFDPDADYRRYVDGKPRYEGVRSFLESRGIELAEGEADDPPRRDTVRGLGNRKNRRFLEQLERDGVEVYPSSVELVRALRAAGVRTAVVSSSRNCAAVLAAAGIEDLFEARVDGVELERNGLAGKPAPDMFVEASRRLGATPARCIGVEDARAGVAALRAAGFALVVGVDRGGQAEALRERGADIVVGDLAELEVQPPPTLPSALEHLDRILADDRRPALFLDYDGTLTPIVSRPEDAVLDQSMRGVLERLADLCPVAVVSGRDLADVRERVDVPGIWYAGSHGFDIAGPDGGRTAHQAGSEHLPALDAAQNALGKALEGVPGCQVERKRFSIAVHYRRVAEASVDRVRRAVQRARNEHPELRLSSGKKIYELQPDIDWDKGRALQWLLRHLQLDPERHLALYIGDDVTDEDAFRALGQQGVGIVVSPAPGRTAAAWRLNDPSAVRRFLQTLAQRLETERP